MKQDWENPAVTSIGREPPRTYSMPLASVDDAFSDAIEPPSPYRLSLNGVWKLSWAGNPDLRVKDFWRADYQDADWFDIDVPSCVEMRGFGSPGYTNIRYPHKLEWPLIRDRYSGEADYNPVSSYRRRFSVPESWCGRRVILRFDGVYSAYYVWVNGQKVGYAQDSALPSEFDITRFLVPDENVLAVEVYRWCDGSYLEDQDMFRFSGIFRDVTLWSMPVNGIWDFAVETSLINGRRDATIAVTGCDGAEWALYDAARREVAHGGAGTPCEPPATIPDVALWSAEKPNLYTLVVRKGDDIRARKVGFREIRIEGHSILFNGQKIKFKGVNRHETNPDNGRAVSLDDMLGDITLFKKYNIDAVRTSHYPDHHLWYDLCDRYGIYVVAEANVEGHEPSWGEKGLGRFPEWEHSIVERNVRNVLFHRNHPSVVIWSMGNETGHGDCFRKAIAEVKALDPSRPIHWERGNKDADIDGRMYPTVEWLEMRGKLGDGPTGLPVPARGENDATPPDNSSGKVFFITEYAHAMGNAVGNFAEYWDVIYRYESLSGGCIWDWVDQAIWKYTGHADPATGAPERYLAYGGDFDEQPNDGPFCVNGLVDPFRNVSAKLVEVGHVHRNLVVKQAADGDAGGSPAALPALTLENRFGFTDASDFDGEWELLEDGAVAASGTFAVPSVPPLSSAPLPIDIPAPKPGSEAFLNVRFLLKADTPWAKKGWVVAGDQIALAAGKAMQNAECGMQNAECGMRNAECGITQSGETIILSAGDTKAVFSRATGTLCGLEMSGCPILADPAPGIVAGPRLSCFRAFTDNDIWLRGVTREQPGNFYLSGLTQLRHHARPAVIDGGTIRFVVEVTGSKSAGFTHESVWRIEDDGSLVVRDTVTPHGTMPAALPRLGTSWRLDPSLERLRYYGRGPHENYIDRCTGSFIGIYDSTVTEQYEPYVRPQDCGYKTDVRWAAFFNAEGRGVKFSASGPLFLQALHFTAEDLEFARHRNGDPRTRLPLAPRPEVFLNLDIRQLGLGGASCGPKPLDQYIFPIRPESWTMRIEPYKA